MLLSRKSSSQYLDLLKSIVYENNDDLNAERHSVIDDIFLQPGAQVFSYQHSVLYYVDLLYSLDMATIENDTGLRDDLKAFFSLTETQLTTKIKQDLDRLAATYSLTRSPGGYATGYVRFYSLTNDPLTIPVGTKITTRTTPELTFSTVNDISNLIPKYDGTKGFYNLIG
jgi:hypothetical protein